MRHPRVLVVGCGSIGRRHIGNLLRLGAEVLAHDPDAARSRWAGSNLGCRTVPSLEAGLDAGPAAVWICSPSSLHAGQALQALSRGLPCFVEKPLAHTLAAGRAVVRAAERASVPVGVGYQLRWDPAVRWLKRKIRLGAWGRLQFVRAQVGQYLPDWRPWQDYRKGVSARRSLGGGVLLEASHEIDLALHLAGEARRVYCRAGRLSDLKTDVEDTASLVLAHQGGAVSEIHLDMVSRGARRTLELSFARATVLLDWLAEELRVYTPASRRWTRRRLAARYTEHYEDEARWFLRSLGRGAPQRIVPAGEALSTLAVVEAAKRSSRSGREEQPS